MDVEYDRFGGHMEEDVDYTKVSIVIGLIFLTCAPNNCDLAYLHTVGGRRDGEVAV